MFKKQISTTLGILIVVLVAGGAGASVLFFNQEKETIIDYDIVLEENNFIDNNEENISETNELEDWNTYRNNEYGYEIKYPNNWKETEIESYSYRDDKGELINDAQISFVNSEGKGEYVKVRILSNPQNLEPLMFHKESCTIFSDGPASREYFCKQGYKESKNVSNGENNFLQYTLPDAVPYVSSQISGNGYLYEIIREFIDYSIYEDSLSSEYETIYDKMLFTFKLL